jgi:hypothetical protein
MLMPKPLPLPKTSTIRSVKSQAAPKRETYDNCRWLPLH